MWPPSSTTRTTPPLTADFRQVLGLSPSLYRQQTMSERQTLSDR